MKMCKDKVMDDLRLEDINIVVFEETSFHNAAVLGKKLSWTFSLPVEYKKWEWVDSNFAWSSINLIAQICQPL